MSTSTALVGPLPQIRFYDGTRIVYTPPRNTLDLRFRVCTDHHPACDCREAEFAEYRQEVSSERDYARDYQQAGMAVLRLHQPLPARYAVAGQCRECAFAQWPCPTVKLLTDVDIFIAGYVERGEYPW